MKLIRREGLARNHYDENGEFVKTVVEKASYDIEGENITGTVTVNEYRTTIDIQGAGKHENSEDLIMELFNIKEIKKPY